MQRAAVGLLVFLFSVTLTGCSRPASTRRAAIFGAAAVVGNPTKAHASTRAGLSGVGSEERCENGEGEACERLADGNPLILELQQRSRDNKEKRERELFDKTVRQLGYSDFFDTLDQNLVRLPNGNYTVLGPSEYAAARKAGKIKIGSVDELIE